MSSARPSFRPDDPARLRQVALAAAAVAVLLLVVAAGDAAIRAAASMGDNAAIELRVRDVGTTQTPMLGPYSRFDFLYPGPLLFWVLAVPYRLVGATSLAAAAGALNALAIVAAVLVASRSQHRGFPLVAALTVLLLARAQGDLLLDPWNPWVPVCWYVVLHLVCWRVAVGEIGALPLVAVLSSFVVQSHLQYALPSLMLALWCTSVGGRAAWAAARELDVTGSRRARQRMAQALLLTIAVLWLAWLGPVVDHLTSDDSNMAHIVQFVTAPDGDGVEPRTYAAGQALEEIGYVARPLGPWVTGHSSYWIDPSGRDVAMLAATSLLAGAIAIRLHRQREREALLLVIGAVIGMAGAYVQLRALRGVPAPYLVRVLWPTAACLWLAVVWGGWRALPSRVRRAARTPALVATTLLLAVALVGLGREVLVPAAPPPDGHLIEESSAELLAAVPPGVVVAVRHRGSVPFLPIELSLHLERHGRTVAFGEPYRSRVGDRRTDRTATVLVTVVEGHEVDAWLEQASTGDAGLELVTVQETAHGRRERLAAAEARTALLACDVATAADIDGAIARREYGALRERAPGCAAALEPLDAAASGWQAIQQDGRWGRYAIFVQPIEAVRR